MEIVDVSSPIIDQKKILLNETVENELNNFINVYSKRDEILAAGINTPRTLLLYGPPGCGKTTIANYIAMKTKLPLVTARLDGLISSLLGSTAKNIRKIFDYASKQECVLFLDEFDVIAKVRDVKNFSEIKQISKEILSGEIGLKPYYLTNKKKTPCEYCEYKSICQFDTKFKGNKYRIIMPENRDDILNKMENEVK